MTSSSNAGLPELPNKEVNKRIAVFSTVAALGLFLSTRLDFGVSLRDLTALAQPYEAVCLFCHVNSLSWSLRLFTLCSPHGLY